MTHKKISVKVKFINKFDRRSRILTIKDIFEVQETTPTEKLVLLYLHQQGCAKQHKKIKIEDVIEHCNLSRSSVGRAFKGLEEKGLTDVFYQRGKNQAKHIKIIFKDKEV